jgi:cell division protein FtsB
MEYYNNGGFFIRDMKRNILFLLFVLVSLILVINSAKRIITFKNTFQRVDEAEQQLSNLREENESLKKELEYKSSEEYVEESIRDNLGLVKEGESVVILPKEEAEIQQEVSDEKIANWSKWWNVFFGT